MFNQHYKFTLNQIEKLMFFIGPYDITKESPFIFHNHQLSNSPAVSFLDNDEFDYTLVWNGNDWEMLDIKKQIKIATQRFEKQLKDTYDSDYYSEI